MYAVFSITEYGNPSLSFNLSSSIKAVLKFRSELSLNRVRASHVRSLFILACIFVSIIRPDESLFVLPIIVDKFISCTASEKGSPVLDLLFSSSANDLHSLPLSSTISAAIVPQLLHTISPDSRSVTILPPVRLQVKHVIIFCIITYKVIIIYGQDIYKYCTIICKNYKYGSSLPTSSENARSVLLQIFPQDYIPSIMENIVPSHSA